MPIDFDLTISGLCVIVLESNEDRPARPDQIEVLCVDAPNHRPRLSYWPEHGTPDDARPGMCVDPRGRKHASLDIRGKVIKVSVQGAATSDPFLSWGAPELEVPDKSSTHLMNWVPPSRDLGVPLIRLAPRGDDDTIPTGASARLILPPGQLRALNIARDLDSEDSEDSESYLRWNFPAAGKRRAIANEVVYRVEGARSVRLNWDDKEIFYQASSGLREVGISNDLAEVPNNFPRQPERLHHLQHLEAIADGRFDIQVPELQRVIRTGEPICNQVLFVDQRRSLESSSLQKP